MTTKSAHSTVIDDKIPMNIRCDGENNNVKQMTKAREPPPVAARKSLSERKNSAVAVVQPRKKEKVMDERLMEQILQMQIKKNSTSLDNRNNNQNSINQTKVESNKTKQCTEIDGKIALEI